MGTILSIFSKPNPPHNYEAILKHADSLLPPDATSSLDKLYPELFDGVFLKHKKQVFNIFFSNFLLFSLVWFNKEKDKLKDYTSYIYVSAH